jgi:uncharacterized damage-inducible protein DinB
VAEPLVEAWEIHDRIHRYLLAALQPEHLAVAPPTKGRTVGKTFGHVHDVRLMWLQSAAPAQLAGLAKIGDAVPGLEGLAAALEASGAAIARLIAEALAAGGRVKGFKPHVHAFVGYLISHESHHRGQVAIALKAAGVPLDRKVAYGLWEWGSR